MKLGLRYPPSIQLTSEVARDRFVASERVEASECNLNHHLYSGCLILCASRIIEVGRIVSEVHSRVLSPSFGLKLNRSIDNMESKKPCAWPQIKFFEDACVSLYSISYSSKLNPLKKKEWVQFCTPGPCFGYVKRATKATLSPRLIFPLASLFL